MSEQSVGLAVPTKAEAGLVQGTRDTARHAEAVFKKIADELDGHLIRYGVEVAPVPLTAEGREIALLEAKIEGGKQALEGLAAEHERIADMLAITFQKEDDRNRATWPHRWLAHVVRSGLEKS